MSFAIVTDSLAGLPLAQIARRGLVVIPLSYTISGKEHLCLAPEGYDSAAFFQTMKLRGEVSTSMVPPHRFLTFLKPLLRSGLDLLFLSASSGLSSSYQSACMAAEQLREVLASGEWREPRFQAREASIQDMPKPYWVERDGRDFWELFSRMLRNLVEQVDAARERAQRADVQRAIQ